MVPMSWHGYLGRCQVSGELGRLPRGFTFESPGFLTSRADGLRVLVGVIHRAHLAELHAHADGGELTIESDGDVLVGHLFGFGKTPSLGESVPILLANGTEIRCCCDLCKG